MPENLSKVLPLAAAALGGLVVMAMLTGRFFYRPFNVTSDSLAPTLVTGDYVLGAQWSYHDRAPARGDIAVVNYRGSEYLKRIIGLPGEHVQMKAGILFIGGKAVPQLPTNHPPVRCGDEDCGKLVEEVLPGGKRHLMVQEGPGFPGANTPELFVPAGWYFVLGDNRGNSLDSRFDNFGFVPAASLTARAAYRYFSGGKLVWDVPE